MKRAFSVLVFTLTVASVYAQAPCSVQAFANPTQITCGDSAVLSAFGSGSGNLAFQENFNSGSPVGWQFTQTVTIANNTCGVPAPDGSPFMWMGDASVNPRDMTTVAFDLTLGGTICFEMRYSEQADASPCEGPDEPDEGVYIQYSTNGGTTWTTIQYYDPNGGYDPQLLAWNQYCVTIPLAAQTPNTMIRWHQDDVSGAEYDHWGIDNVAITLNDPNFTITWGHDGYSYGIGSPGGINPTPVMPLTTTTYPVLISDGTTTCHDSVTVVVLNPVLVMSAEPDTSLCPGECVQLTGNAYWQIIPAGTPVFENNEFDIIFGTSAIPSIPPFIPGSPGTLSTNIDINVVGLNMTTIAPGSIAQVCINGFNIVTGATLANVSVVLTCPGGSSITLVPVNTAVGTTYYDACFVPAAPPITTGAAPYTGTWNPSQAFDALAGCPAEGLWTLTISGSHTSSFPPIGMLSGWSIEFNDPDLMGPVSFVWSPTTNMTNANTLTPTVCPTSTTTYTLIASNHPGCMPDTANVTVTVPNSCCQLQLDNVAVQQPSCTAADGEIVITVSGQVAGLEYSIDNGATFQSSGTFTGLASGTYTVLVQDDNNCPVSQTITLTAPNAPVIDDIQITPVSCNNNDGAITITVSGGTPNYTYSINGGTSSQSGNTFTGLSDGVYPIEVEDDAGCIAVGSATLMLPNSPSITSLTFTPANCGATDGSATVVATGGTGGYTYGWSPSGGTGSTTTGIGSGTYTVTVTDANNCSVTGNVVVTNIGGPTVVLVSQTDVACFGQNNGSAEVEVTQGGTAPFTYDWSPSGGSSNIASNLGAGTYTVTVTDVDDCVGGLTVTITEPTQLQVATTSTPAECGQTDGAVGVSANGGTVPYTFDWGSLGSGSTISDLGAGVYPVTVTDDAGCEFSASVTVQTIVTDSLLAFTVSSTPESCVSNDGSASVQVTNGVPPYDYQWNIGLTPDSATVQGIPAGEYTVTVTDECYSLTVPVTVEKSFTQPDKNLPNIFTPNIDGINDIYSVGDNFNDTEGFFCVIYNRWGAEVHKTENKSINWVGEGLSDGVYFLIITYTDCLGEVEKIASSVTRVSGGG